MALLRRAPFVTVFVAGLMGTACGGGPAPATGRGSPATVAVEAPLSGAEAASGRDIVRGAELAAEQINSAGGLLGHPIHVVIGDDRGLPLDAGRVARALEARHPVAVVGPFDAAAARTVLPLYRREATPVVSLSTSAPTGNGVRVAWVDAQIAPVDAQEIVEVLHARTVALLSDGSDPAAGVAGALETLLVDAGVSVPVDDVVAVGADPGAALAATSAVHPDVVVLAMGDAHAGSVAAAMARAKVGGRCVVADSGPGPASFVVAAGPKVASGCVVAGAPPPSEFPGGTRYTSAYRARYRLEPGPWGAFAYDALGLVADAARRAGSLSASLLSEALRQTTGYAGVTGTIDIDRATGERRLPPLAVLDVSIAGVTALDPAWAAFAGWAGPSGATASNGSGKAAATSPAGGARAIGK
ncbi:MAG: branched-chain amino acid ABC transporter substrate-binding protein [Acidimicrobiales bacterium]